MHNFVLSDDKQNALSVSQKKESEKFFKKKTDDKRGRLLVAKTKETNVHRRK